MSPFHKKLLFYSSGGPFIDGYILGMIGLALVQAGPQLDVTATQRGLIGASALIGIFIGGASGGWLADRFGRQKLYAADLVAIVLFSALQFWVTDAWSLFLLRLLLGIAIGADYPIATSLLAEFIPSHHRGRSVALLVAAFFVGSLASTIVGTLLLRVGADGWRWMLASGALPALLFVFLRHGTPESPRWLAANGRAEEARLVLQDSDPNDADLSVATVTPANPARARDLVRGGYGRRVAFIATFWTCSVTPLFAIYAFGPLVLAELGFGEAMTDLGSVGITLFILIGILLLAPAMESLGRRPVLLASLAGSGAALLGLAETPHGWTWIQLAFLAAYALTTSGSQALQWVYPNELFPTEIRGLAVGVATSLSRIGAAIGTYFVPFILERFGVQGTFLLAAMLTGIGFVASLACAPETRGRSLEQAAAL